MSTAPIVIHIPEKELGFGAESHFRIRQTRRILCSQRSKLDDAISKKNVTACSRSK